MFLEKLVKARGQNLTPTEWAALLDLFDTNPPNLVTASQWPNAHLLLLQWNK